MKLFIDFDGVLFHSNHFRNNLVSEFEKSGFSTEEINNTYNSECLDGNYTPTDHLRRLEKIHKFNFKMAVARSDNLINRAKKYLYGDVVESLKIISKLDYDFILFTLGSPKFQSAKVKKTAIRKYFDQVYYTSIPKVEYLAKLVRKNEKFIIVDDRGDALTEISKKFPKAVAIEMRREKDIHDPAERPSHFSGPKITNLKQLIEIL